MVDDAERRARAAVCDIITGLGKMPKERLPALVEKLEAALAEAKGLPAPVPVKVERD